MLYRKNRNVIMYEQDNEGIAQMSDGTLHILNTTAYEVYSLCENNTKEYIIDALVKKYQTIDRATIQQDVADILGAMLQKDIISNNDEELA